MNKLVKEIQAKLKQKGFDPGSIDGDLGPKTLAALKAYFSSNVNVVKDAVTSKAIPVVEKTKDVVKVVAEKVSLSPVAPEIDANKLQGRERPLYAKKVLMDLGWKDYQAAAMVGQFMQESYSDLRTNIWGDNRTAYGIGQWRDHNNQPGRLTDLYKFAAAAGNPIHDFKTQILFANWELTKGSEVAVGKRLKSAKNIDEALEAAIGYERPRGYKPDNPRAGHGWSNREAFAKSLL